MRDDDGRYITSFNESVDHLFKENIIYKNCEECGQNTTFRKTEKNTGYPQVLVVQYVCFGNDVTRIGTNIFTDNVVKLNNVMFRLTGIVVHQGPSLHSAHYYAIICCWDTGIALS